MYFDFRFMWFWIDGSPNFFNQRLVYRNIKLHDMCTFLSIVDMSFQIVKCSEIILLFWSLCERDVQINSSAITHTYDQVILVTPSTQLTEPYQQCEQGHYTHAHLSCDTLSGCDTLTSLTRCQVMSTVSSVSVEMFDCEESGERVHFTQVCDFRHDCTYGEDETRCVYPNRFPEGGFRY